MSKTRFLSVAAAEFALHKLHMTLTILRKNKNTTTSNLLTPLSDLRFAQDPTRKELVRVQCKQSCSTEPKPSYSRKTINKTGARDPLHLTDVLLTLQVTFCVSLPGLRT